MSTPSDLEPSTAVLVIAAAIAAGDSAPLCARLDAVTRASGAQVIVCDVHALAADARSVDALARMQLTARRLGTRIRLHRPSPELEQLLAFLGLAEVVGCADPGSGGRRGGGQPEEREQPRGIEERVDRDDAIP